MEQDRIELYQLLNRDGIADKISFDDFVKKYFSSENNVLGLYSYLISHISPRDSFYYTKSNKEFFSKYACDLLPNSKYCGGTGKSGSNFWDTSMAAGDKLIVTTDPNQMRTSDGKFVIWNTGRVMYTDNNGVQSMGTMEITSPKSYKIKYDDGDVYDSTTAKVTHGNSNTQQQQQQSTSQQTNNPIDVNIKPEEILDGTKIVKMGMKGDIVTQIQQLLIKNGLTNISKSGQPDGVFGSRTTQSVRDFQEKNGLTVDGVVGKNTWSKLTQSPTNPQIYDTSDMDTPESLAARDNAQQNVNENKMKKIKLHSIIEQNVPMMNTYTRNPLDQTKQPDANTKVPYATGNGWWTPIENYLKTMGKFVLAAVNDFIQFETVVGVKSLILNKDGSVNEYVYNPTSETPIGKWSFTNNTLLIQSNGKTFDFKTNQFTNGQATQITNCANQLVDVTKGKILKFGCKTQGVKELQTLLDFNPPTGYFGAKTLAAVKAVQQKNNIKVDGIVGPETYKVLAPNAITDTKPNLNEEIIKKIVAKHLRSKL